MATTAVESPPERVLLIHAAGDEGGALAGALGDFGLRVTSSGLEETSGWPPGIYDAALVRAESVTPSVRVLAQRLKFAKPATPVVLWSHPGTDDLATIIGAGFDAVVPSNASSAGVAAQVRALCRLAGAGSRGQDPGVLTIRGVTIDLQRREVAVGGRPVALTPTEFRIIAHMARQPGRVVSHQELFRDVHGYDASEQEAKDILKVHISRLRTKLSTAGIEDELIVTVRGFGYLLERRTPRRQIETGPEE